MVLTTEAIPPAVVRLYHRMTEIAVEVEDALTAPMSPDEFLGYIGSEAEARTIAAALAGHAEYQWLKAEIGRLLGIGPGDIHPLDLTFDEAFAEADSRFENWKRALHFRFALDRSIVDRFLRPSVLGA
jgi:hypothetical protein